MTSDPPVPTAGDRPGPLKGRQEDAPASQEKVAGWHWTEWACELAGTAFQLFLGFTMVAFFEAPHAPGREAVSSPGWRLVLIGVCFGILAAIVAVSPVGKRSGAHLNPAVTFGFFLRKHTHPADLVGYVAGQLAGALLAAAALRWAWSNWSAQIGNARTEPGQGTSAWEAVAIEAGLTMALLLVIFNMVSSPRTARWTPAVVTGVLSGLIWVGAPYTGASMNPARTLGPDLVTGAYPVFWVYLVGPIIGAALAEIAFRLITRERTTLTAKLFHDSDYPSTQRTVLPAKPHSDSANQARATPDRIGQRRRIGGGQSL